MRFRKRARNVSVPAATAGNTPAMERKEVNGTAAIASDERSALLRQPGEAAMQENGTVEAFNLGADPTQRLLTALGRFQRQVAKAGAGAAQDSWCDECVQQIVVGIEIAHSQGWINVREALTDTARILQSYEEPRRAEECIAFLQDSYEILCLMVGDIIVDNTRSGVMRKWRERYQHAVRDLQSAGLRLISDDDDGNAPDAAVEPEAETESLPIVEALPDEPWAEEAASTERPAPPLSVLDSPSPEELLLMEETEETAEDTADQLQMAWQEVEDESDFAPESFVPSPVADSARVPHFEEIQQVEEELEPAPHHEMLVEGHSEAALESPPFGAPPLEEMPSGEHFDSETAALAEPPAYTEDLSTAVHAAPVEMPSAERADSAMLEEAFEPEYIVDTPASEEEADMSAVETTAEFPPPPAEASGDAQENAELKALFQTVQNAVIRGDVTQAKVLALQLAASMAQLEVDRAQHELEKAHRRLEENQQATADAEQAVRAAEEELQAIEQRIGEGQSEFETRRQQTNQLRERVLAMEKIIEDIDAQILALQERREQECLQREQVENGLEEALAEESRVQTALEELAEIEQQSQEGLEQARQRVEQLRQLHQEQESVISHNKALLEQRKSSAGEIERTLGGSEGGEGGSLGEAR